MRSGGKLKTLGFFHKLNTPRLLCKNQTTVVKMLILDQRNLFSSTGMSTYRASITLSVDELERVCRKGVG